MMKYMVLFLCMPGLLADTSTDPLVKAYEKFARKMSGYEYVANEQDPTASFLMSTSEITNLDYLEFLHETRTTRGQEAHDRMLPDTSRWEDYPTFGSTLAGLYHHHPVYHRFPVVNITHEQARAYCQWLQGVLNTIDWITGHRVEVKLPSVEEWTYAATGGIPDNPLPWPGTALIHGKETRAFYHQISPFDLIRDETGKLSFVDSIQYFEYPAQIGIFLGDVHELETGFWGLAHLGGNAAEFVEEPGITKGGSWRDPAYYLQNHVAQNYQGSGASVSHGFRVLVRLVPDQVN